MKNFIFKSNDSDLQKMFQYIETKLDIIGKNLLYSTHQSDKILSLVKEINVDSHLQKQVDEYFDERDDETSPQTESDTNET